MEHINVVPNPSTKQSRKCYVKMHLARHSEKKVSKFRVEARTKVEKKPN